MTNLINDSYDPWLTHPTPEAVAASPVEFGAGDEKAILALSHQLDSASPNKWNQDSPLDKLSEEFLNWYNIEKQHMGVCPLGSEPMDDIVMRTCCYARMCAGWDAKCSCGEHRTGAKSTVCSLPTLYTLQTLHKYTSRTTQSATCILEDL